MTSAASPTVTRGRRADTRNTATSAAACSRGSRLPWRPPQQTAGLEDQVSPWVEPVSADDGQVCRVRGSSIVLPKRHSDVVVSFGG